MTSFVNIPLQKIERFLDSRNTGEYQVFLQPKILLKLFGGGSYENLLEYYRKSDGATKKKILGCIFSEKLVLEK